MLHAILAPKLAWRGLQTQRINGPAHLCPRRHPQPSCIPPAEDPTPCAVCPSGSSLFEGAAGRLLPFLWAEEGGLEDEGPGPMGSWGSQPPEGGFWGCPWGRWCIRTQGCLLSESQGTGSQSRQAGGRGHMPLVAVYRHPPSCWVLLPNRTARVLRGRNRVRGAQTEEAAPCRW